MTQEMATTDFLIKKWKQFFHVFDTDKDNILTIKDADLFAEKFSAAHNFDEDKTKQVRDKYRSAWKTFVLLGGETGTKEEFITNLTEKFNANHEELRIELKESFKTIAEIIDVNNDGLISPEELMVVLSTRGVNNTLDESFIAKLPQVEPGFIKIETFFMFWLEHMTSTDETVYNPVSEKLQAVSGP